MRCLQVAFAESAPSCLSIATRVPHPRLLGIQQIGLRRVGLGFVMATEAATGPTIAAAAAIDFFALLQNLKTSKRTGWVRMGVDQPESIADHMYRMGMMALVAGDCGVDYTKAVKIAIVHDVAEAIVGDITPTCGISKEQKARLEADAMEQIETILGKDSAAAKEVKQLWLEYENASSPEAVFVKDLDKLEMILQAHEYESTQGKDLQEFFDSTRGKFKTPTGQAWAAEVTRRRDAARAARLAATLSNQ